MTRARLVSVVVALGCSAAAFAACVEDGSESPAALFDASVDVSAPDASRADAASPDATQADATPDATPPGDASPDAAVPDATNEASADAAAEGGGDAAPTCVASLANVGAGDFRITFDVDLNTTATQQTVLAQRAACFGGCTATANFWHLRVSNAGKLAAELCSDGGTQTLLSAASLAADAGVQHVVVQRLGGVMSVTVGGADAGSLVSAKHLDALQSAALCQATGCACEPTDPGFQDGTQPLSGTLTNVCLEKL